MPPRREAIALMLRGVAIMADAAEPEGVERLPEGDAPRTLAMIAGAMNGAARAVEEHAHDHHQK